MPVQAAQWTEFLSCPICYNEFDENVHKPISLGCSHTVCKTCLNKLHRKACPFDQTAINTDIDVLPVNFALLQLVGAQVWFKQLFVLPLHVISIYVQYMCWYFPLILGWEMARLWLCGMLKSMCTLKGTTPFSEPSVSQETKTYSSCKLISGVKRLLNFDCRKMPIRV